MRYITADYIFPVSSPPIQNGVVVVSDNGIIEDILRSSHSLLPTEIETYKGIICPGFINTHCHLELSHLKGKLSEGKRLTQFIKEIIPKRNATPEVIQQCIKDAEDEMLVNGIVGIGDICNTHDTFAQKAKRRIRYHNFIELFDIDAARAESEFEKGMSLAGESKILNLKSKISLTPHASYTVTPKFMKLIKDYAVANDSVLSIHNEETASENEMFVLGKGELLDVMKSAAPVYCNWKATGKSSLAYILENLSGQNKLLLVHNTYATKEDIELTRLKSVYFCFCPNANLFIENRTPDFQLFIDGRCKITIGTDSYASNWSLNILDELKTIHSRSKEIPLATLLQWATLNGAEFFGWDKELGSIEKGKKPGLNLIEQTDLNTMQLTAESTVRKIA